MVSVDFSFKLFNIALLLCLLKASSFPEIVSIPKNFFRNNQAKSLSALSRNRSTAHLPIAAADTSPSENGFRFNASTPGSIYNGQSTSTPSSAFWGLVGKPISNNQTTLLGASHGGYGTISELREHCQLYINKKHFIEYLQGLGYLDGVCSGPTRTYDDIIRRFQMDYGLSVNGRVDKHTASYMCKNQCTFVVKQSSVPHPVQPYYSVKFLQSSPTYLSLAVANNIWQYAAQTLKYYTGVELFPVRQGSDIHIFVGYSSLHKATKRTNGSDVFGVQLGKLDVEQSVNATDGVRISYRYHLTFEKQACWFESNAVECRGQSRRPSLVKTMLHYLGHIIGMPHSCLNTSIMYGSIDDNGQNFNVNSMISEDKSLFFKLKQELQEQNFSQSKLLLGNLTGLPNTKNVQKTRNPTDIPQQITNPHLVGLSNNTQPGTKALVGDQTLLSQPAMHSRNTSLQSSSTGGEREVLTTNSPVAASKNSPIISSTPVMKPFRKFSTKSYYTDELIRAFPNLVVN